MPSSRQSRPPSPSANITAYPSTTPARPVHARRPSTSYTPTVTSGGQPTPKVNVTRLAIEGRARQNADGTSIKMYLKISFPTDSVTPGATVPLFAEENVKILDSQVHPLDNSSVPYNFSSGHAPLLHNAARALNLPPRSPETFYSAFGIPAHATSIPGTSSRIHHSLETDNESSSPVDPYYTGQILVSNYAISYIVPKVFPRSPTDQENSSQSSFRRRRASISERNTAQFMAAIDMWVPYVSKPPRSPFLLSIPLPRCLQNNINLRIFPPNSTSSSVASISSIEDDPSAWELASDPHVTRISSSRLARTNSYNHFADDESSDSSQIGSADGCGIKGTFPSAERIRIRWAKPMKVIDVPDSGDARRRVGVREVKGEMTCTIQGKHKDLERNVEGVVMHVAYKGTCKGIWFPGVATLLGLDVGLEAKNSEVSWVPGLSSAWEVGGGVGYTGFDVGRGPSSPNSRSSSLDSSLSGLPPPLDKPKVDGKIYTHPSESTPSLLHAPLPAQNTAECSFEGSSSETISMDGTSSVPSSLQVSTTFNSPRPPGMPITLHLNMNELLPPVQSVFTFMISGTILLGPRMTLARVSRQGLGVNPSPSSDEADSEPVVLPRFTVLAADAETTSTVVRSEVESGAFVLEVYNASGDLKDAQIRKTVLQKGGSTKCSDDGGRIILKAIRLQGIPTLDPLPRPLTPNGQPLIRVTSNSPLRALSPLRPQRDGPLIIPTVDYHISLFMSGTALCHAIRAILNTPREGDSEWLEFGLALPRGQRRKGDLPRVSIVNASIEGVPVRTEMTSTKASDKTVATGVSGLSDNDGSTEWIAWIKLHAGTSGGTRAVIDYLVRSSARTEAKKTPPFDGAEHLLLPSFSLPVGRLDGRIITNSDIPILNLKTNLAIQQFGESKCRFSHFSSAEFFIPEISLTVNKKKETILESFTSRSWRALPLLTFLIVLFLLYRATMATKELSHLSAHLARQDNLPIVTSEIIVTTTVFSTVTVTSTAELITTRTEFITRSPTSVINADTPKPLSGRSATPTITIIPQSTTTDAETAALSLPSEPIWPIRWIIENVRTEIIVDKLWDAAEVAWQWLRKAYHYPLDPPNARHSVAMDVEKLEGYLGSVEQYFFSSVSTITASFPDVHDAVNRLWVDISRYGPGLPSFPEVHLSTLGDFQVPPPPPPPPHVPRSWFERSLNWSFGHPWKACGLAIGTGGTGFLIAAYTNACVRRHRARAPKERMERRRVVVVLGGDTAFALPLIQDLERNGYIVIVSVSTPEECSLLESKCQGYVRALVLDPSEPAMINVFLRSLTSTLSLRFPLNASGDPFASTTSQPYIHSVISLLTLSFHLPVTPGPLEHVSLNDTYIRFLTAAQITPLRVIQCLLPLLRASPRDKGKKSIIVCLPATEARVGIPFASIQSMTAASTLRAMEVLRREINLAAMTDKSDSMRNIKVVIAEVGALKGENTPVTATFQRFEEQSVIDLGRSIEGWTPSEKMSYGPAFTALAHDAPIPSSHWHCLTKIFKVSDRFGIARQPTDASVFVSRVIDVVSDGAAGPCYYGLGFLWRRARILVRGDRFSVGAGALTYKIASYLPALTLDTILNLPAVLISFRDRLLDARRQPNSTRIGPSNPQPSGREVSENDDDASESEVESNASDVHESSWVRLHRAQEGGNPWQP